MISKSEIEQMVRRGDKNKYSHVLICVDQFDYEYYPVFVSYEESVQGVISQYNDFSKMSKVMEVYNYNLDLDKQLNENRSYHIDPIVKPKTEINDALEFATLKHSGQYRKNGVPYISHPIKVSEYVEQFKTSKNIEILKKAAYLHDTLEDTNTTYYDLVDKFGSLVASLVLELTTDKDFKNEIGKTKYLAIKMKNMSSWALVIKLCDRLSNVSDLENCDEEFVNRYLEETKYILNFLSSERKLSRTHIEIIKKISEKINSLEKYENNILSKVYYTP